MEPFIRVAFWTVTLFCCLQATPVPPSTTYLVRPLDLIKDSNIERVQRHVTCVENATFYTPIDVKANCIGKALECVMLELERLVEEDGVKECDDFNGEIPQTIDFLYETLTDQTVDNSPECACERWPETNFTEFLDNTVKLLQFDNTEQLRE